MIRVVLDTNIVVSALFSPAGLEDRVLNLGLHGYVQLYISTPVLAEYQRVLTSSKFNFRQTRVRTVLQRIVDGAHTVQPMHGLTVCSDEEDNRVLECAEAAGADFLITGNKRHFPAQWKQTSIVNARQFLEQVFPSSMLIKRPRKDNSLLMLGGDDAAAMPKPMPESIAPSAAGPVFGGRPP